MRVFKSLGNEQRLKIIDLLLKQGGLPVYTISERIRLSFRSTSKHLSQLVTVQLVEPHRRSRYVYYAIAPSSRKALVALIRFVNGL